MMRMQAAGLSGRGHPFGLTPCIPSPAQVAGLSGTDKENGELYVALMKKAVEKVRGGGAGVGAQSVALCLSP